MYVQLHDFQNTNVSGVNGVNIATGASGSEVVQIADLVVTRAATAGLRDGGSAYMFPFVVPAGTRIAANCRSNVASETVQCNVMLFDDAFGSVTGGGATDTYGFNTAASLGTQIDPGASANTKGSYVQITASTTYDLAGFFLGFDGTGNTPGSLANAISMDVGVGSAGNEVIVLPDFPLVASQTNAPRHSMNPGSTPYFPIKIPAGSRIAIRAQSTTASSPSRLFGVTFYGVRL
jgi:hypothetical protein